MNFKLASFAIIPSHPLYPPPQKQGESGDLEISGFFTNPKNNPYACAWKGLSI